MQTVESTMNRIGEAAEAIKSDAERRIEVMDIGDEVRQGDLYITRIESIPSACGLVRQPSAQLAPGNTQGSRHTLRSLVDVQVFRLDNAGPLDGPIIVSEGELAIDHPEHGDRILPPGCYAITYQRAYAEELRRVED